MVLGANLVIDTGSGSCKAGFADENTYRTMIPCIVGRLKHRPVMPERTGQSLLFVGDEAQKRRGMLALSYPMEHGVVRNWDHMEQIWSHLLYSELKINPSSHRVLLSEPPLNPKNNKEKMAEVWYERFSSPELHISIQAVLSLYASGKTSGISVDIGDGVCHVVPIYEGYTSTRVINRSDIAGRDITNNLSCLLKSRGYYFNTSGEREIVRTIKENMCEVMSKQDAAKYHTTGITRLEDKAFTLPDGQIININEERVVCPEMIFTPSDAGFECSGLHECIYQSIMKSDIDLRKDLYENITLSGGSTLFPGLPERLLDEVSDLASRNMNVKVYAPSHRRSSVWLGGAILASLTTFQSLWVSRQEYFEHGSKILHQKCI